MVAAHCDGQPRLLYPHLEGPPEVLSTAERTLATGPESDTAVVGADQKIDQCVNRRHVHLIKCNWLYVEAQSYVRMMAVSCYNSNQVTALLEITFPLFVLILFCDVESV